MRPWQCHIGKENDTEYAYTKEQQQVSYKKML